jgi:hypothetical protein
MKIYRLVLVICVFNFFFSATGQHISGAMQFASPVQAKDSNSVSFAYSNLFYFRDYEYFNNIQTGYTLFGTWHHPRLVMQPNKWLRMEAGAFLQKEFGDRRLERAWPMFSIQLQQKNVRLIFGALEGAQTHQLTDPMMSYDKIIDRPMEEGMQLKLNTKRLTADLWLDWELRQRENADYPEELTAGLALNFNLTEPGKPLQLKIPVAFLIPHKGGQLDTNSSPVISPVNSSAGLAAEWNNPDKNKWLKQVKTEAHYTRYSLSKEQQDYPFKKGNGTLLNVFIRSKWDISLLASYWSGHTFIAPKGNKLMQSISSIPGSNATEPERRLLFLNLIYEKELFPGFFMDARYNPVINLEKHKLENSYLILLSYRNLFRLGKLKK